jgi:hypothetical protein
MICSVEDMIEQFGGPAAFAREVGMSPGAAKQAKRRNSLGKKWIVPTARAAKRCGVEVTESTLLRIADGAQAAA